MTSVTQDPFAAADAAFEALKQRLRSGDALVLAESEVERVLAKDGREVLRSLLQGHLDLRTGLEARVHVVGDDSMVRSHVREGTSRQVKSVFGDVVLVRKAYTGRELCARMPLDGQLNLPDQKWSLELRRLVALNVPRSSFDETVSALDYHCGLRLGKRQVEEQARAAAVDFDAFYAGTELMASPEETGELLVITTDGKGVVMLPDSLRPATRRAAEDTPRKLKSRLCRGEKKGRKRMATVAAVYTIDPFPRCAEDVMANLRPVRDSAERIARPKPQHKRVWASLERTSAEVIEDAFIEALSRDPERQKRWVVCVDGARHQLDLIRSTAKRMNVEVTIVIDLIHVIEYLWKAAHVLGSEGTAATERWVQERLRRVLDGEAGRVAGDLRRAATMRQLEPKRRKQVDTAANYLTKNKRMLRYDRYLADGLPIATGVIEGACRHLICDRLDITGARWSLEGAEAVLRLRALRSSGDFDHYWEFHEAAEADRNHAGRYLQGRLPDLIPSGHPPPLRLVGR